MIERSGEEHDEKLAIADVSGELAVLRALALQLPSRWALTKIDTVNTQDFAYAVGNLIVDCTQWQLQMIVDSKIAREESDGPGIEAVVHHTSRTLSLWDRACRLNGRPSPFEDTEMPVEDYEPSDTKRSDVAIMLAATLQTAELLDTGAVDSRRLSPISFHDIGWLHRWLDGEQAGQWALAEGVDLDTFNFFQGRDVFVRSLNLSPRSPLDQFIKRYEGFSDFNISLVAQKCGFTEAEAKKIFTPSIIKRVVLKTISGHSDYAERYGNTYASELSISNLSAVLDADEGIIKLLFGKNIRSKLAWYPPETAISQAQEYFRRFNEDFSLDTIARLLDTEIQRADVLFPFSVRKKLASHVASDPVFQIVQHRNQSLKLIGMGLPDNFAVTVVMRFGDHSESFARSLIQSLEDKPKNVSEELWFWTSILGDPDKRDEKIASYKLYLNLRTPLSLDTAAPGQRLLIDTLGNFEIDPAEILFGDIPIDPASELNRLAVASGLSPSELSRLTTHFADSDESDLSIYDQALLQKLRSIARANDL